MEFRSKTFKRKSALQVVGAILYVSRVDGGVK
jgi:hypothetical protein